MKVIPEEIKREIYLKWYSGKHTHKELAKEYKLKYDQIGQIIRKLFNSK